MVTERNYEIYDKELLAIMLALDEWRHYLMGAAQDFEIWTDHQNLQYFQKPQKLNRRQARWVTELAEYHFSLHHKPGASNKKADLLSRRPDHEQGKEDNDEVIVLNQSISGHWSCQQSRKSIQKSNKPRSTTTDGTRTSLRP